MHDKRTMVESLVEKSQPDVGRRINMPAKSRIRVAIYTRLWDLMTKESA